MISDQTTFVLAFTAVFAGIAWLLIRLEARTDRLAESVAALVQSRDAAAANQKTPGLDAESE